MLFLARAKREENRPCGFCWPSEQWLVIVPLHLLVLIFTVRMYATLRGSHHYLVGMGPFGL